MKETGIYSVPVNIHSVSYTKMEGRGNSPRPDRFSGREGERMNIYERMSLNQTDVNTTLCSFCGQKYTFVLQFFALRYGFHQWTGQLRNMNKVIK